MFQPFFDVAPTKTLMHNSLVMSDTMTAIIQSEPNKNHFNQQIHCPKPWKTTTSFYMPTTRKHSCTTLPNPSQLTKNCLSNLRYHLQQCVKGLLLHQSAMFTSSHSFPGIETTSKKTSFQIHLEQKNTKQHEITKTFRYLKWRYWTLSGLFWGWVFPYMSLTYSLYRWVVPF